MPRRVVIFGGAGFLGSHLCDRFLAEGHRVVCVDNYVTGSPDWIAHHSGNPLFEVIEADVSHPFEVHGPVDAVLHFASPASPSDYQRLPVETLRAGSLGTFHALELCRAKRARFILASTSEVYGDPTVHPQPESYWGNVNPIGPRSCYDEAKRFSEAVTVAYSRINGVNSCIIRIFNTYGPRMRPGDGRVIPTFIGQALSGAPLTVTGDGTQTRSFCYVEDLVEGVYRATFSDIVGPVNLGNPTERTILEVAKMTLDVTGSASRILFTPLPEDDPRVRRPDISRAERDLCWRPRVDLAEGLAKTVAWVMRSESGPVAVDC